MEKHSFVRGESLGTRLILFFEVLCVTAHHAKSCMVTQKFIVRADCCCNHSDGFRCHYTWQQRLHTGHSFVQSILHLQYKMCVLQVMNPAEPWSIYVTTWVNFESGVGSAQGIVGLFKHLFCVSTHPPFLMLELRAPMGACLGHYRICM